MTTVRDLALLDRMSRAARALGIITAEFRVCQVYGEDLNPDTLREIGESLRSLGEALLARAAELDTTPPELLGRCALCGTEPVACPHAEAWMVENHFCVDCIDHCLSDARHGHWCPVDAFAHAQETGSRGRGDA